MPEVNETTQNSNGNSTRNEVKGETIGPMPKHIPFPDFSVNSELVNELIMFIFMISSSIMQFINIYRTSWWLPQSHTNHVVNFYLIDPYLAFIILIITMRRLMYCLLLSGLELLHRQRGFTNKEQLLLRTVLRYAFGTLLTVTLSFCVWKVYVRHSYFALFILLYPIIVYILIFGFKIEPFLRTQCEVGGAYLNGLPMHSCSSNPTNIREEIDFLRNDFNIRFRQIIFTSAVNAYFSGFIPCFFAISILYNKLWATQHVLFVWLTGLTMACAFIFPSKYGDLLHRASLHLGYWIPLEFSSDNNSVTAMPYNKNQLYTNNSIVKYNGEYYRSFGPLTVAVPGNTSHSRFYRLFQNPSLLFKILSTFQGLIVLCGIFLLYFAVEWHFILSISFIAFTNQFTLFKIARDYCLTKRIYTAESDKQNNALHID